MTTAKGMTMIKTNGPGFSMTFANGWTVSVQFGLFNYCHNRQMSMIEEAMIDESLIPNECSNAEIAAWPKDRDAPWHDFGGDTVKGWCSPDEIADFIALIKAKP